MAKRRPVLHIDCDGVLSDFAGAMLRTVHELFRVRIDPAQISDWNVLACVRELAMCPPSIVLPPDFERVCNDYVLHRGWCASLEPMPGAKDAIQKIRAYVDVHVVTSPWDTSPYWHKERTEWLGKHFNIASFNVTHTSKKAWVGRYGDLFVDDKPAHVLAWQEEHIRFARLWTTPGNARDDRKELERMGGWDDLVAFVEDEYGPF